MTNAQPRGFIALMSAIIISSVLLIIVTGGSLSGFYSRVNALNGEFKKQSNALADACASQALLELVNDPSYAGSETLTLSPGNDCTISAINKSGSIYSFTTTAQIQETHTTLDITADADDLDIISWKEVP